MTADPIPRQIRRRRASSRRRPVLEDGTGRSDPHDPVRRRRQPITLRVLGQWTVEADGPQVVRILDRLGAPRMRARHGGMWQFPARFLDDFCAYADHLGIRIEAVL
jgi:hypothetical protein